MKPASPLGCAPVPSASSLLRYRARGRRRRPLVELATLGMLLGEEYEIKDGRALLPILNRIAQLPACPSPPLAD